MVGDGGVAVGSRIVSDLMRPGSLAVKLETQFLEFLDDLPVFEPGESTHQVPRIRG
jgi:hypothetical protein